MRNPNPRLSWLAVVPALLLATATFAAGKEPAAAKATTAVGPDVTVFTLSDTSNYGATGGVRGYSVGTTSCNIGDTPLNWCDQGGGCGLGTTNADHPVISQNMYRLKNGRFSQIGASWLKHGFVSTNSNSSGCGTGICNQPPLGGNQLGVGCTDPYQSSLNGSRPLGRKSEVNPTTGDYPMPPGGGGATAAVWNQRLAVAESDLTAAANPGARYFVEGHYVAPDDAMFGNGLNNASYREVTVNASNFNLAFVASPATVRQKAAIEVWPLIDPTVELVNVDTPSAPVQRFHVARKVTEVSAGVWHYEYAVHNMNATRSADRLTIQFSGNTTFSGVGFSDVNAHSNEPYDTADWPGVTSTNSVSWEAPAFSSSPKDGNAIRWSTTYNFWFDATRPPGEIADHTLHLFESGTPAELKFLSANAPLFSNGFEDAAGRSDR